VRYDCVEHTFFYGKRNENHELGIDSFVHKGMISVNKRVEFVSLLRGRWCNIVVLNVNAPTEDA
jgi:hypothetical protein